VTVEVKICGIRDAASLIAAVEGGARYVGFVFYKKSPRAIDAASAFTLMKYVPSSVVPVGLFVDPTDDELVKVIRKVHLGMIQLHGNETPERVADIKRLTSLPVMKAVSIATTADVDLAHSYEAVTDFLLLDAKPPKGGAPGGNALVFDWTLLQKHSFTQPWMLAGGLTEANIVEAIATTKARILDVSSGVEEAVGQKNPSKIKAFLEKAHKIET
jgi:phosphoribosylanthranilate isomerase